MRRRFKSLRRTVLRRPAPVQASAERRQHPGHVADQVVLDLTGSDRHEATRTLAECLVATGRCTDLDTFLTDVRTLEETMATVLPAGIGIPRR